MPLHPAAPEDLAGLVAAYQQTTQAVVDLGRSCSRRRLRPAHRLPRLDRQGPDLARRRPGVVAAHRRRPPGRPARLRAHPQRGGQVRRAVGRAAPAHGRRQGRRRAGNHCGAAGRAVQRARHDARHRRPRGVGAGPRRREPAAPGSSTSGPTSRTSARPSAAPATSTPVVPSVFMDLLFASLPKLVARNAGIEPGNVVIIDSTGPVVGRAGVWVEASDDGKPRGIPLFSGIAHDGDPERRLHHDHALDRCPDPAGGRPGHASRTSTTPCRATRPSPSGCSRTSSSCPDSSRDGREPSRAGCLRHTTIS